MFCKKPLSDQQLIFFSKFLNFNTVYPHILWKFAKAKPLKKTLSSKIALCKLLCSKKFIFFHCKTNSRRQFLVTYRTSCQRQLQKPQT
jgi:hypothetical protein